MLKNGRIDIGSYARSRTVDHTCDFNPRACSDIKNSSLDPANSSEGLTSESGILTTYDVAMCICGRLALPRAVCK